MITKLQERPKEIRESFSNPLPHQRTFTTPLQELPRLVSLALDSFEVEQATASTIEVVFEPRLTLELLSNQSVELENHWNFDLKADGRASSAQLLEALLSDSIDFAFIPKPAPMVIFADHDEFITFYSNNEPLLEEFVFKLRAAGFEFQDNYQRPIQYWS